MNFVWKIAIVFVFLFIGSATLQSQYVNIRYDAKTVAAIQSSLTAEYLTEKEYRKNLNEIRKSYQAASIAAAGIWLAENLKQKSLTELSPFTSDENYYYKQIHKLVKNKIIPKSINIIKLSLREPSTALYWGSYFVKVFADVKNLCAVFTSVVTEGKLNFNDINFLSFASDFLPFIDPTQIGGYDWKTMFAEIFNIQHKLPTDSLEYYLREDFKNFGSAGTFKNSYFEEVLLQNVHVLESFVNQYDDNLSAIEDQITSHYQDLDYTKYDSILTTGGLNSSNYLKSIGDSLPNTTFYTQEWTVGYTIQEDRILNSFTPTTGTPCWDEYSNDATRRAACLANAKQLCGLTDQYLASYMDGNGVEYELKYELVTRQISGRSMMSYSIQFIEHKTTNIVRYSEIFDSYSMDYDAMTKKLQAICDDYNLQAQDEMIGQYEANPDYGHTFIISRGEKNYYQRESAENLQGLTKVTFYTNCSDTRKLGSGTVTYKCAHCGKTIKPTVKECAMNTTLSQNSEIDAESLNDTLKILYQQKREYESEIAEVKLQYNQLQQSLYTEEDATVQAALRAEMREVNSKRESAENLLANLNNEISQIEQVKNQSINDQLSEEDDQYHRIPAIMSNLQNSYSLTWTDEGSWSGDGPYYFTRYANMPDINGVLKFQVKVYFASGAQYFLGIRIHRARVNLEWELTTSGSESTIVDYITFEDPSSDSIKADIINKKVQELREEYTCPITYQKEYDNVNKDSTINTFHLLWPSDRLEVARTVYSKLINIYSDLIILEKYLHYKYSVLDWIKRYANVINNEAFKKDTVFDVCRKRWMHCADSTKYMDFIDETQDSVYVLIQERWRGWQNEKIKKTKSSK